MRVGNFNPESNFFAADITFSHGLHLLLIPTGIQPKHIANIIITDYAPKIKFFFIFSLISVFAAVRTAHKVVGYVPYVLTLV